MRKIVNCGFCGKEHEKKRSIVKNKSFCSRSCSAKHRHKRDGVENHPNWNGGKRVSHGGYIELRIPNHHRTRKNGYVFEHIIIAEKKYGVEITKEFHVHHIDGNKQNNDPNNLELLTHGEHTAITMFESRKGEYLKCDYCNSNFYRKQSHVKKSKYCSKTCHAKGSNFHKSRERVLDKELIVEQIKNGKNISELAIFFKVNKSTIYRKIKKYNISTNKGE